MRTAAHRSFAVGLVIGATFVARAELKHLNNIHRRAEKFKHQTEFRQTFGVLIEMTPTNFSKQAKDLILAKLAESYGNANSPWLNYKQLCQQSISSVKHYKLRRAIDLAALYLDESPNHLLIRAEMDYRQNAFLIRSPSHTG